MMSFIHSIERTRLLYLIDTIVSNSRQLHQLEDHSSFSTIAEDLRLISEVLKENEVWPSLIIRLETTKYAIQYQVPQNTFISNFFEVIFFKSTIATTLFARCCITILLVINLSSSLAKTIRKPFTGGIPHHFSFRRVCSKINPQLFSNFPGFQSIYFLN